MQEKIKDDHISRQAAKLRVARVIWEEGDSCYDFHDKCVDCLDDVPPAQPEITEEDVREWCYKRGLTIIDNALYLEMKSRWSASVQSEIIRCKDCYHYPNEYADCPMIGWARNEDDFCSKAESRTDG